MAGRARVRGVPGNIAWGNKCKRSAIHHQIDLVELWIVSIVVVL